MLGARTISEWANFNMKAEVAQDQLVSLNGKSDDRMNTPAAGNVLREGISDQWPVSSGRFKHLLTPDP